MQRTYLALGALAAVLLPWAGTLQAEVTLPMTGPPLPPPLIEQPRVVALEVIPFRADRAAADGVTVEGPVR